ncbi:MAG TPA: phosphohydrolase [Rhodoferax sp.]|jgi:HD-GYP domain-containing protein (c-di-GMP phosphodiesterase class II)|nr:phosphohydrolase [Rhodoferax sp.]HOF50689.1 phosphohydrolase [Rhodoferax sp.]HQC84286.1 phosphohydrolase [Rhodoferax sp.]
MNLVPVSFDSIRIGQPLPFPLVDEDGVLLARKSFVVESRAHLEDIVGRGRGLFIDVSDSGALHRAYVDQLQTLVRSEKSLGEIADTKLSAEALRKRVVDDERIDWLDLQVQTNYLLRDSNPETFQSRLVRIDDILSEQTQRNPDGTLFALIHLSATETQLYSATHAMLVSAMCSLASREVLGWSESIDAIVRRVALTMNVCMTDLQDKLALQVEPPTPEQRAAIDNHPKGSGDLLRTLGVGDPLWLEAVRYHHHKLPGPLLDKTPAQRMARLVQRADMLDKTPAQRMARLVQRADMFAARLAPRASRVPISPAAAMQACYFDENRQVDEAGAALIKAVGIYQPGSFVRLATDEVGVVVRRGQNTSTPRVAVVVNRSGMPTGEPIVRDTSAREHRIVASVPHREVKVKINLERMLPLTATTATDRPW